eukprot:11870668-Alexandrium_andersonii.AAC.1
MRRASAAPILPRSAAPSLWQRGQAAAPWTLLPPARRHPPAHAACHGSPKPLRHRRLAQTT